MRIRTAIIKPPFHFSFLLLLFPEKKISVTGDNFFCTRGQADPGGTLPLLWQERKRNHWMRGSSYWSQAGHGKVQTMFVNIESHERER